MNLWCWLTDKIFDGCAVVTQAGCGQQLCQGATLVSAVSVHCGHWPCAGHSCRLCTRSQCPVCVVVTTITHRWWPPVMLCHCSATAAIIITLQWQFYRRDHCLHRVGHTHTYPLTLSVCCWISLQGSKSLCKINTEDSQQFYQQQPSVSKPWMISISSLFAQQQQHWLAINNQMLLLLFDGEWAPLDSSNCIQSR